MKSIELNIEKALGTVSKSDVFALENKAKSGMEMLHKGTGKGNDFLGWLHLLLRNNRSPFSRPRSCCKTIERPLRNSSSHWYRR